MSYFVYILRSLRDKKLYVGCSNDLLERFDRHQKGGVTATKSRRPLELIYSQEFDDKTKAFQRERFLKSLWGAREKKKILKEYINKIERNNVL